MAIAKNTSSDASGKFIRKEGEYKVTVTELKTGNSKKGDPMLTVTFSTEDGQSIRDWFVKTQQFRLAALATLKKACGLPANAPAEELQGKACGINVEAKPPDDSGKVYYQVVGYGNVKDVEAGHTGSRQDDIDSIPF